MFFPSHQAAGAGLAGKERCECLPAAMNGWTSLFCIYMEL